MTTPAPAPMTARLRELMEEATPGPWDCWDMDEFGYHIFEKKRGTKQDCRKSLMAVRWGRSHPEGPNIPHQRDPGRTANFNEMVANAELVCELVNNAPTILRLLEAVEGAEKALAELPQKVLDNATLCHELSVKLAVNGEHAMAEMQRIRAEQSAGLAEAIKRETDAALVTLRAAREGAR